MYPFLEVDKIEGVLVVNTLCLQPFDEIGEVLFYLFSVEDSVYHMTTKQSHLNLIPNVRVNALIVMYMLEDITGGGPI